MRSKEEKKHYILKAIIVFVVLFFAFIIFADFTPETHSVEKVVFNNGMAQS